jgi:hypothetical protein
MTRLRIADCGLRIVKLRIADWGLRIGLAIHLPVVGPFNPQSAIHNPQ